MRLDECQAGFLSVKLKHLNNWTQKRKEIANWYIEALSDVNQIILPKTASNASHVYHLFVIRTNLRDDLQKHLNENEIGTLIHYPIPPHLQLAYAHLGHQKGDFPVAEEIADTCLSLPMWPGMTKEMVEHISIVIKHFFR
jgi:dTDP-4-amino-4,6-dideoxygalactose transaminase